MKHLIALVLFAGVSLSLASDQSRNCQLVSDLIYYTAPVVERFSNIVLPYDIYSVSGMDIKNNMTLQFAVKRNGSIRVRLGPNNTATRGTFDIYIPVKIVDTRVDWFEKGWFGETYRHHEDFTNSALTLKAQVKFEIRDNTLYTTLNNGFHWDKKPTVIVLGFTISVGTLAGEQVQRALSSTNGNWKLAVDPALQDFINGNCEWKDALYQAYLMLDEYKFSRKDQKYMQEQMKAWINAELR